MEAKKLADDRHCPIQLTYKPQINKNVEANITKRGKQLCLLLEAKMVTMSC